jgi:hypothetical protein
MRKVVGIDRKIKRAWLDSALDRLTQTTDEAELRTFLDRASNDELRGKESRAKSVGIVLRIWSGIPNDRVALRDRALAILPRITGQERLWLHWGMAALAYPFFRDAAEVVGRLLALQDDFTTAQVQARLVPTWGDRATIKKAAQALLTTLADWEVLRPTKKGHFLLALKMKASTPDLQLWLLEAILGASAADEIEAQQLLRLPEAFPFTLSIGVADLRRHEGFNIHRQGLDMDMVGLRKVRAEQPTKPAKKPRKGKKAEQPPQQTLFGQEREEVVTGNGQPRSAEEAPAGVSEPGRETGQRRRGDENDSQTQALEPKRPVRLQFREMRLLPDNPFGDAAAESVRHLQAGDFYASVALTQAVLEALVHHVWQANAGKKKTQEGDFLAALVALHRKAVITDEWKNKLQEMWVNRHKLHQLRASSEEDQRTLEAMARANLSLLEELKEEFFGCEIHGERVVPNHPEYWTIREGEPEVLTVG